MLDILITYKIELPLISQLHKLSNPNFHEDLGKFDRYKNTANLKSCIAYSSSMFTGVE